MEFKCNLSGCVYNFESELDIKSMLQSRDYVVVPEEQVVKPVKAPLLPTTVVQVKPLVVAPDKPIPVVPAAV